MVTEEIYSMRIVVNEGKDHELCVRSFIVSLLGCRISGLVSSREIPKWLPMSGRQSVWHTRIG